MLYQEVYITAIHNYVKKHQKTNDPQIQFLEFLNTIEESPLNLKIVYDLSIVQCIQVYYERHQYQVTIDTLKQFAQLILKYKFINKTSFKLLQNNLNNISYILLKNRQEINEYLQKVAETHRQSQSNQIVVNDILHQFKKLMQKFQSNKIKEFQLKLFGSSCNGFGLKTSDIDISIQTDNPNLNEKSFLYELKQYLKKENDSDWIVIPANKPLLEGKIKWKNRQFQIDILVNNACACKNTKLLFDYSKLSPKIELMGLLLKIWGKKIKLIERYKMSSYGLLLMLFYFLIKKEFIAPLEYDQQKGTYSKIIQMKQLSSDTLGNLLQFFQYYSEKGEFFTQSKQKICCLELKYKTNLEKNNKLFRIVDPFDRTHNPGRLQQKDAPFMFKVFDDIIKALKQKSINLIRDLIS